MPAIQSMPLVVLISGSGSNLQSIIDGCANGQINAHIAAVISNKPGVYGLERAHLAGITAIVLDHKQFASRDSFDAELQQLIDSYQPGLVVLAGFMRILTPSFVDHYLGRMLNIHPSLLPNLQGLNTHQRALDAGYKQHGASVHFVTPELDGGPVANRATIDIKPEDNSASLAKKVLQKEHKIYPETVAWFSENRLCLRDGKAILDGKTIPQLNQNTDER